MKLVSVISDPLVILDGSGAITSMSPAMHELLGTTEETQQKGEIFNFVSSGSVAALKESAFPTVLSGQTWSGRLQLAIDKDHQGEFEASMFPLDVEPLKIERQLAREDLAFALLFGTQFGKLANPYAIAEDKVHRVRSRERGLPVVFSLDADGRILVADAAAQEVFDTVFQDLSDRKLWDLPNWLNQKAFAKHAASDLKTAFRGIPCRSLASIISPTGRQKWLELSFNPDFGDTSNSSAVVSVNVIGRDVTERIQSEITQRRYTERLNHLSRELLRAQEVERRRIAQELHDEIGQSLTALRLSLHNIRRMMDEEKPATRVVACMGVVDQVLHQVRNLSLDLWPTMLEDLGLVSALNWFILRQQELTGLEIEFNTELTGERWPRSIEVASFRIAQEAISNAMKHSGTDRIEVKLDLEGDYLVLSVRDFGLGFETDKLLESATEGQHLGIMSMQQRAVAAFGSLNLESSVQGGTRITVRFDVSENIIKKENAK